MKKMYEESIKKIRKELEEKNCDAILIFNHVDVLYLSGFYDKENNSVIIITKDKLIFMTDGRFVNQFNQQVDGYKLIEFNSPFSKFKDIYNLLIKLNVKSLMFNYQVLSYQNTIDLNIENIKTTNSFDLITNYRRNKKAEEIKYTKKACKIAEDSLLATIEQIKEGMTELQIQNILNSEMSKRGSLRQPFPTIIASGKENGASPHATPTDRKVEDGDFITIDFGAVYNNYSSDITRTISIGKPNEEMLKIYNKVKEVKESCVAMLKPGQNAKEIHMHATKMIEDFGYEFQHGLGHGIGLENHELPKLTKVSNEVLEVNDIHTIEPGIYVPGICGVRIEDDYLITENGYECLTPNITTDLITI